MPPKRRSSLGRSTSAARRMEALRGAETPEETQTRVGDQRARQTASRAVETSEDKENRQDQNRARRAVSRASETPQLRRSRSEDQRQQQAVSRSLYWMFVEGEAFQYHPVKNYDGLSLLHIGQMTDLCPYYNAFKWSGEAPGMSCSSGKVKLPTLEPPPEPLESLMSGTTTRSKHFLENIRKYNSCFQMTSFGASNEVCEPGFMPIFKVKSQVYHLVGSLLPPSDGQHKSLQIYCMGDERLEARQRCNNIRGTRQDIVIELQQMLHQHNTYVHIFKTALQRMPSDAYKVVIRADKRPVGEHARRFNAPTTDEVAIVIAGNEFDRRDIVLEKKDNQLRRVAETHRSYDALQYPLIFWAGEDGYHFLIPRTDPTTGMPIGGKKVSAMNFYAY